MTAGWNQVRHFDTPDETAEQDRIRRFTDVGPYPEMSD